MKKRNSLNYVINKICQKKKKQKQQYNKRQNLLLLLCVTAFCRFVYIPRHSLAAGIEIGNVF